MRVWRHVASLPPCSKTHSPACMIPRLFSTCWCCDEPVRAAYILLQPASHDLVAVIDAKNFRGSWPRNCPRRRWYPWNIKRGKCAMVVKKTMDRAVSYTTAAVEPDNDAIVVDARDLGEQLPRFGLQAGRNVDCRRLATMIQKAMDQTTRVSISPNNVVVVV